MSDRPTQPFHRALFALSATRGRIGASIRRKLARRRAPISVADFETRLTRLTPQDICIDMGANMGVMTELLAATGAQVHSYEPDPHCFAALQKRFADRPNVHLHNVAIAATSGSATLQRTRDFDKDPDAQSVGSTIAITDNALYDPANTLQVETRSFTDLLECFDRPVAIVKMDIEGAEFPILDQILATPERFAIGALFVETHERFFPERLRFVKTLRQMNWDGTLPFPIDTFWP